MEFLKSSKLWDRSKPNQISQIYGTLIFLGLTVYFFLMYAIGAIHVVELRLLNIFIMVIGVYLAMKQYRRTHDGHMNYFRALTLGTATAVIGTATFALFLFFFLKLEGNLMQSIQENEPLGHYLNPYIASYAVLLEGIFSGFGVSYLLVNYLQTDRATEPQGGDIQVMKVE
jgi:EamA domain-containing membrane protein RarD